MRLPVALTAVAALAFSAGAALASPVSGVWRSPTRNGLIQIYDCGPDICGRVEGGDDITANPDVRDAHNKDKALQTRRVKGLTIMTGFHGGPTEWSDGSIYDPDSGNTYHGTVTVVDAATLHLKGCVVAPFCRTQTWTRAR